MSEVTYVSEENKMSVWGKKTRGRGDEALKRFFTTRKKIENIRKRAALWMQNAVAKCWICFVFCFFIIIIIILHGKVAVNDISAFYLRHFTFFMSFNMFLARFACHTAKTKTRKKKKRRKVKEKKKKKWTKWTKKKMNGKNPGSEIKKTVDSVGAYGLNQSVQKQ